MKKTYCKPEIMFESFELSANIARSCGAEAGTANQGDWDVCGIQIGSGDFFLFMNNNCSSQQWSVAGQYDTYCYHGPTDLHGFFSS